MTQESTPKAPNQSPKEDVHKLARAAGGFMLDKKARDVMLLDLSDLTSVCDYFVLATADSEPQVKAMVEAVEKGLKDLGQTAWSVEGIENRSWVVLDYVDFVVHIFTQESRDTYVLEKLWGDAPQEVLEGGE